MSGARVLPATAYRDGTVVCDRVLVTVIPDERLGLAPRERRQMTARFVHGIEPGFRSQLMQGLHRRGARSRRLAEALDPIELELDGSHPSPPVSSPRWSGTSRSSTPTSGSASSPAKRPRQP